MGFDFGFGGITVPVVDVVVVVDVGVEALVLDLNLRAFLSRLRSAFDILFLGKNVLVVAVAVAAAAAVEVAGVVAVAVAVEEGAGTSNVVSFVFSSLFAAVLTVVLACSFSLSSRRRIAIADLDTYNCHKANVVNTHYISCRTSVCVCCYCSCGSDVR